MLLLAFCVFLFFKTSICAKHPFFHHSNRRSVSPNLEIKDAQNFFACGYEDETCLKVRQFSIKHSEKIGCHDENLPIEFKMKDPRSGIYNISYGYITQQKGAGIVLEQNSGPICKTFKQ